MDTLTSSAHLLKLANRLGEDFTNLHEALIFLMDRSISFNSSLTIKFKIWAEHYICMNSPFNKECLFQTLNALTKYEIAKLWALALSTVTQQTFEIPHSFKQFSRVIPMVSLLWLEIK